MSHTHTMLRSSGQAGREDRQKEREREKAKKDQEREIVETRAGWITEKRGRGRCLVRGRMGEMLVHC